MSICIYCDEEEGELRINPYMQDVHDEEIEVFICDECFDTLCDDI